jgi:hypothetical protein
MISILIKPKDDVLLSLIILLSVNEFWENTVQKNIMLMQQSCIIVKNIYMLLSLPITVYRVFIIRVNGLQGECALICMSCSSSNCGIVGMQLSNAEGHSVCKGGLN